MLLMRRMPKNMGTVVLMGCFIPMALAAIVFLYSSDSQENIQRLRDFNLFSAAVRPEPDLLQRGEEDAFKSSFAYRKQVELDQLEADEGVSHDSGEGIQKFEGLTYRESLRETADQYGHVMIKFCEDGRIDNAINFHETSVVRNDIHNVLYIAPEIDVCRELWKVEIKCHVLEDDFLVFNNSRAIEDQRNTGKQRAIARIKLILKALTAGYTVLFTDVTTLYMKNPYEFIQCEDNCDVAISVDNVSLNYANWAIHLAKPRRSTVYMYARVLTILGTSSIVTSKETLNSVIGAMMANRQIAVKFLDAEVFSPASNFFVARRFYDDKTRCKTCVAIFEDRGISKHDQIYQLKEQHLWHANFDEYYSSRRRLYLVYENVWLSGERRSLLQELTALRNALALGQALGRIVILPKFHCPPSLFEMKYCGLSDLLKIAQFDYVFGDMYRENTFLDHPKVSREVRRTMTDAYYIGKELPTDEDWDREADVKPKHKIIYIKTEQPRGITVEGLEKIFRSESSYNLLFHSLYEGITGFDDRKNTMAFNVNIREAFKLTTSVQTIVGDKSFEFV